MKAFHTPALLTKFLLAGAIFTLILAGNEMHVLNLNSHLPTTPTSLS